MSFRKETDPEEKEGRILLDVYHIGIVLLGLSIGLLSGLLGVGGGFLVTPLLNVLFGVPYNIAVGSGLTQMVGTSLSGVVGHRKLGHVDTKLGLCLIAGSVAGSVMGTSLINRWRDGGQVDFNMSVLYMLMLFFIGASMARDVFGRKASSAQEPPKPSWLSRFESVRIMPMLAFDSLGRRRLSLWFVLVVGVLLGVLSGLMGVGGGFVALPFMMYGLGMNTVTAVGTSLFLVLFASLFASITHVVSGNVDWLLVVLMLSGSIIGAQAGVRLAGRVNDRFLRRFFVGLVFLAFVLVLSSVMGTALG